MARPIDITVAKRIIQQHRSLLDDLKEAANSLDVLRNEILRASDALVAQEVMGALRDIPIEEINRDKRGIRVKALREHGYLSISDISAASVYTIASIHGISEDSAYTIKSIVDSIVDTTRKGTKIKLSEDKKTPQATQLITAIARFRKSEPHATECQRILKNARSNIEYGLEDILPSTSRIKWFLASKEKKQRAIYAYDMLTGLLNGPYHQSAKVSIDALDTAKRTPASTSWEDFSKNSVRFFNILEDINPGVLGTNDTVYGLPEELAREIQDQAFFPDGLLCELRRYQEWGVKYALHQERILLGDEMGLGKTIQAIATMVSLKNTGATHFVVVCPASVLANWCREIRKMSKLSVTKIHGNDRYSALQSWIKTGGVAVTTYETTGYFNLAQDFKFSMLVVDEAHYIKNPEAQRTMYVKMLCKHADRLLFMTGTALENKVDEMIALIKILQPQIASTVHGMEFLSSAPQFREKVAPVYYRRKREDVLTELPDLIESREWCSMTPVEEAIYEESILGKHFMEARRVSWNVPNLKDSSKARRMMEIIDEATSEGRKIIVFSFFHDTIHKIKALLGKRCYGPINGSVSPQRRQDIIDQFDASPAGSVLTAQIQAGGTGLNIQSASVVIICEPQFKPSIENQAISRAYRMGQTRNVLVHRLLCDESIDERITSILEAKQAIFDAFADKSVAATETLELDDGTFGNIIKEEIDRVNAKRGISMEHSDKVVSKEEAEVTII